MTDPWTPAPLRQQVNRLALRVAALTRQREGRLARLRVSHPRVFPAEEVRRALAARLSRDGLVVEIDAWPADVMAIELAAAEFEPAP